jgi:hypothetical protein
MKQTYMTVGVIGMALLAYSLGYSQLSVGGQPVQEFRISAKTTPAKLKPGPAKLTLSITPLIKCKKLEVVVPDVTNMKFKGPMKRKVSATMGKAVVLSYNINIAAHDTCGLRFEISAGSGYTVYKPHWISVGDSVVFVPDDPRDIKMPAKPADSVAVRRDSTGRPWIRPDSGKKDK